MDKILKAMILLRDEAFEFDLGTKVTELNRMPTAIEFATQYLGKNEPLIVRGAVKDWPALQKWTPEYLKEKLKDKLVTVAQTPNGYADGLAKNEDGVDCFVLPKETEMKMSEFLKLLEDQPLHTVSSIEKQNSNLTTHFSELLEDIDFKKLSFATQCFVLKPDACNFWYGDGRGVTSMHKDPYENLYCVVKGYKDFILLPPHQLPFIPRSTFPMYEYKKNALGEWQMEPCLHSEKNTQITQEWIAIDPLNPDMQRFPHYEHCTPIEVRVNAGDCLYLPNYWFHHVRQSHGTIAVNLWYDMEYDIRYPYFRMLEKLSEDL